jgi:nucleoside-diphosphate-sugar epimerase
MRVLLIGGTRFVGYLTAWRLLLAGHAVTLLNRGNLPDPFGDRVERLRGDRTTDLARLVAGRTFDAAIDFVAFDGADVDGAVAALAGRLGHYVVVSSGQVYLLRPGLALPSNPAREEDYDGAISPRPSAPDDGEEWDYGAGKRAAEDALARAVAAGGLAATAIRIPMVHGERDYHRRLEGYLWRLADRGPLLLPTADDRVRHVYGGAVARALVDLVERPAPTAGYRAYNLAQAETPTLRELVATLADAVGAPPPSIATPTREAMIAAGLVVREASPLSGRWMSFLDPGRAVRELGFAHEPVASYLGRIAASFLAHPPDAPPPGYRGRARELDLARRG